MSRWFRFYDSVVDDPKVQRLPPDLFKAWVNVLCVASKNNGSLPPVADLAFLLRVEERAATKLLARLVEAGLLDEAEDRYAPHGWDKRQHKSDDSGERVRRLRERRRNGDVTVTVTPPDTETETDTDSVPDGTGGSPPKTEAAEQQVTEEPEPTEAVERLWKLGPPHLVAMGLNVGAARSNIGRWMRDTGNDAGRVLAAIVRAREFGTGDPIPLVGRILRPIQATGKSNGKALNDAFSDIRQRLQADERAGPVLAIGSR